MKKMTRPYLRYGCLIYTLVREITEDAMGKPAMNNKGRVSLGMLLSLVLMLSTSTAWGDDPDKRYLCNYAETLYKNVEVGRVGLGKLESAASDQTNWLVFCRIATDNDTCYSTQHNYVSPVGSAEYALLVYAHAMGQKINFWCSKNGWAENIHLAD